MNNPIRSKFCAAAGLRLAQRQGGHVTGVTRMLAKAVLDGSALRRSPLLFEPGADQFS
jgi:hypothetical protein